MSYNVKALVGAFNQKKVLVGAFSVIVQPVVEPMEHYTALLTTLITSTQSTKNWLLPRDDWVTAQHLG